MGSVPKCSKSHKFIGNNLNNFENNFCEEPGATAPGFITPRVLRGESLLFLLVVSNQLLAPQKNQFRLAVNGLYMV